MFQIIGIRRKEYTFDDGRKVTGYELHMTEKINSVEGYAVEKQFISDNRLEGYMPKVGDEIEAEWSRYKKGKIERVFLLSSK